MKPYLIDSIAHSNVAQQAKDGKYYIAKPLPYQGCLGIIQRMKHAWLVFRGKATAVQFKSDIE